MNPTFIKSIKITAVGCTLALLTACVDLEEQERQEKAALELKSCAELSYIAADKKARISEKTEKYRIHSLAAVFSSGDDEESALLSADLAEMDRKDLQKDLHHVELLMARKGCK